MLHLKVVIVVPPGVPGTLTDDGRPPAAVSVGVPPLVLSGNEVVRFAWDERPAWVRVRRRWRDELTPPCPGSPNVDLGMTILALPCAGLDPPWAVRETRWSAYPSDK